MEAEKLILSDYTLMIVAAVVPSVLLLLLVVLVTAYCYRHRGCWCTAAKEEPRLVKEESRLVSIP